MFGGSDTATQVADMVEVAGKTGLPQSDQVNLVASQMATMPAEAQVELTKLKVALGTRDHAPPELAFADKQAEQSQTQETIRQGDNQPMPMCARPAR